MCSRIYNKLQIRSDQVKSGQIIDFFRVNLKYPIQPEDFKALVKASKKVFKSYLNQNIEKIKVKYIFNKYLKWQFDL